jgi:hypothetical protein
MHTTSKRDLNMVSSVMQRDRVTHLFSFDANLLGDLAVLGPLLNKRRDRLRDVELVRVRIRVPALTQSLDSAGAKLVVLLFARERVIRR